VVWLLWLWFWLLAALPLLSVARPLLLVERVTVRPPWACCGFRQISAGGLLFTLSPIAGVALLNFPKICAGLAVGLRG